MRRSAQHAVFQFADYVGQFTFIEKQAVLLPLKSVKVGLLSLEGLRWHCQVQKDFENSP